MLQYYATVATERVGYVLYRALVLLHYWSQKRSSLVYYYNYIITDQRFALRMCLKNWSLDHSQLYSRSMIPPLTLRRSNARLEHLFKIVNNLCDFPENPIQQRDIVYVNRHTNPLQLVNIQARTNQFYNSFFPKTIALWNSLPSLLLSSLSLNSFKSGLRQHFNFNSFLFALSP